MLKGLRYNNQDLSGKTYKTQKPFQELNVIYKTMIWNSSTSKHTKRSA